MTITLGQKQATPPAAAALPKRSTSRPLYLDIETIPGQAAHVRQRIADTITPPGNYKKQETIDKWWEEQAPTVIDEKWHATSLKPWEGEIYCIAYALGNNPVRVLTRGSAYDSPTSEADLLRTFWDALHGHRISTWIAHNAEFDIRTLYARSVVHQTRPTLPFPPDTAPWKGAVTCTMHLAAGLRGTVSLDTLCHALNIPTPKDTITGGGVWNAVQNGEHTTVTEYCKRDVEALRQIHHRLTFTTEGAAS